jgi:hypothetical protein
MRLGVEFVADQSIGAKADFPTIFVGIGEDPAANLVDDGPQHRDAGLEFDGFLEFTGMEQRLISHHRHLEPIALILVGVHEMPHPVDEVRVRQQGQVGGGPTKSHDLVPVVCKRGDGYRIECKVCADWPRSCLEIDGVA